MLRLNLFLPPSVSSFACHDCIVQKLEEALRLLKDYGGVSFGSFEEVFMAQRTPVDDELHMMAACLAYFKVCTGVRRVCIKWYGCARVLGRQVMGRWRPAWPT